MKTGKVVWRTAIEKWQNGYGITGAPLYYDGLVYSGITGGEFGVRGRLTALDAKTGEIKWRWYTLPGPGDLGSETWPAGTDHAMRGRSDDLEYTGAGPGARPHLLRGRQLRAGL
jgi:quinohemoprotein ethanol dehydrogenase